MFGRECQRSLFVGLAAFWRSRWLLSQPLHSTGVLRCKEALSGGGLCSRTANEGITHGIMWLLVVMRYFQTVVELQLEQWRDNAALIKAGRFSFWWVKMFTKCCCGSDSNA